MQQTGRRHWRRETHRASAATLVALAAALAVTACGGSGSGSGSSSATTQQAGGSKPASALGTDDGTQLTMWTRSATQAESQLLVDAYNATHKNQVKITAIPNDSYIQKVGQAAGGGQLPDLFASDIVYATNFASKNLWHDISDRIKALPYGSNLAKAAIDAGTVDGKAYVVPHTVDTSVLFYNKALYKKAGLDPDKPPTTLEELAEQAHKITQYGHGNYGTYFGGNCPGCIAFTWWPSMWADGATLLGPDGKSANFADDKAKAVFALYRKIFEAGDAAPGAKSETGATWVAAFGKGNIGVMAMPSSTLDAMPKKMDIGVAPLPGLDGGAATFVGGDVLGISSNSKHVDAAWNFIAWSLGDKAQVDVLAQHHYQLARTDLSSNQYTSSDPRLVAINSVLSKGQTPVALNFGQSFNDPNGPWLKLVRDAVFGDASKVPADNDAISASLAGS